MNNATKATVSAIGTLMGVAGIEHGIGEILQGNVAPAGIMFPSWPDAAFFRIVAGEPAMSIIPNLLVTGILSIVFSVSYLLWAILLVQRKNSGLALILLSIAMLLAGGGIFPPVLGAIIGVLGTRVNAPLTWWRTHLSAGPRQFLGKMWRWSFVACVIGWLLLFPGINIFGYFFGVDDPTLTVIFIFFAFGSLLLTIFTGFARDSIQQENGENVMKYKSVVATKSGGPEVLQIIENDLRAPSAGEVRIKVLTASVCRPDVTARSGKALYSGTPLGQKFPFVPGYAVIGDVDAVGQGVTNVVVGERVGVLTIVGGYTEILYWRSDRLIPVPSTLNPAEAVPLILNYIVAYQALHRSVKVKVGEKALIIGGSGGIGTALLQLGQLAGLEMYALASKSKHPILAEYGATPIDYHTQDFADFIRRADPGGIDVILDGMMRLDTIQRGLSLLRHGGRLVSFGEPQRSEFFRVLATAIKINLLPNGKSFNLYGTSFYFIGDKRPFLEDWATLFKLLETGKIKPVIAAKFPILEAAKANELLESGQVVGNVVLLSPELI